MIGFSRAVRVGDRVMVSGTAPINPDGSVDPVPLVQAERCLAIVAALLDPRWRVEIEAEAVIGSSPPPLPVR